MRLVFKKTIAVFIAVIGVIITAAQDAENWTALSQTINATEFAGKKFKFSGAVKTSGSSEGLAMLWARVDKKDKKMGFFDNMQDRPVMLTEWKEYSIEGIIDQDAQVLNVGVLCVNNGSCYYDVL